MKTVSALILVLFISLQIFSQAPKWKVELGEAIKNYDFINEGKYLFFTNGEYVWCYNASTGDKIWEMEVNDFNIDGIHSLVGELYVVNSGNNLQCFDALTGKKLWENSYEGIDQGDFTSFEFIEKNAVLRYGEDHLGIDLSSGKEIYRMKIEYWGELVNKGTFNYSVLSQQKRMLVMEDGEKASLYDIANGNKLFTGEDFDINEELITSGNLWLYKSPGQSHLLFVLDNGAAVIDVANKKEIARKEFDINGEMNVLIPTTSGCAVLGTEKIVHFNFETGQVNELDFPVEDFRTLNSYDVNGKSVLVVSMADQMAGIDVAKGQILWQTKEDDPDFEGYAHKYILQDGSNIIFTYNRARLVSTESGTYIYIMSIDALTGKLNYKTTVLLSQATLTGFQRSLAKTFATAFSAVMGVGSMGTAPTGEAMDMVNQMMGYQNIGFDYDVFEFNGNLIVASRTNVDMWDPSTRDGDGEGFVSVDPKTGKINYKTYFEIAEGINPNELGVLASSIIEGDNIYLAGEERLIGFNLKTGKKLWEIGENLGFVTDLAVIDGLLYAKFGKQQYNVGLDKDDIKVTKAWDEDPFGFHAVDPSSGKILWTVNTETDPALVTPQYSIYNYYNQKDKRLYYADEQNIYALKLGQNGGSFDWTFNFDQNGVGEMEYEKTFAVKETWVGSEVQTHSYSTSLGGGWVMTTTSQTGGLDEEGTGQFLEDVSGAEISGTYTSWGNIWGVTAKRCLRVLYDGKRILVIGPDAISLIDAKSGNSVWKKEWDYNQKAVDFIPHIANGKIIYCVEEQLELVDLGNGNEVWKAEESDKSRFFLSPDEKFFFSINDETIAGYEIAK
ncbi:MAG TPA: PQQ-binding-like beta-propeller repeat protein [Ignavibacteriaceae bacterium]|nr:PQQ-binding-like beta-propeller repeat protein [Ignavibacteriaceae bacterium]